MRKSANLTAVFTAAGVLLFLAPAAPAQSTGSTGSTDSSSQSGQSGRQSTDRSDQSGSTQTDRSGRTGSAQTDRSGQSDRTQPSDQATGTEATQSGGLSGSDRKFVMDAARGGQAEVELGKLAADKGSSDQVKQFGQKMVDDHSKANEELKDLASRKGITLPDEMSSKHKSTHEKLSKLSGAEFDRAYMKAMEKDHNKDVAEFKRASEKAKDPDIKQWASQTLPTLQEHGRMVHETMAAIGASGEMGTEAGTRSKQGTSSTERGDQPAGEQPRRDPK